MRIRKHQLVTVFLPMLWSPIGAFAAETGYQLILQGQHVNNVSETSVDPQSEIIASALGQFNITQTTSDFFLSGLINAQYNDYLDDTFDDEILLRSVIIADWSWTDSLAWRSRNVTNQVQFDQLAPNLPNNRSNQNLFSTGPELIATLGQANRFTLGANYAINTISESPNDSDRITAYTQFRRQMSRQMALSLNYRAQDVTYKTQATVPDYRLGEAFLRLELRRGAITFQGDVGVTNTEVDGLDETSENDLVDLLLRYEQGNIGVLSARYRKGVGDTTTQIDSPLFDPSAGPSDQELADSGLFLEERYELTWTKRVGRVTGTANASHRDQDFVFDDSDQIITSIGLNLAYQFNPRWQVGIGGNWEESEFVSADRDDEFMSASLRVTRSFGERMSIFAEGAYVERDSSDPLFVFDDTRYTLGIVFQGGVQPAPNARGRSQNGLPPGSIR